MDERKQVVIFGIDDMAELALHYISNDTEFEAVAFTVDKEYRNKDIFCGLPVIDYEFLTETYTPDKYKMFVAIGFSNNNKNREHKYLDAKAKGYNFISYISSKATVLNDNKIGENCFILENNTIQPFSKIGNNVVLWSGNHIGHHVVIEDHCFVTSHAVISGRVYVGRNSFIGVNSTIRDHIVIAPNTIIGGGAWINKDTVENGVYKNISTPKCD